MAIIPGKWEVFTLDTGSVVVRSTDGDTEYMVARVWGDGDGDDISTASLIAAAPDLYAACLALRASLADWIDIQDRDDERNDDDKALAFADAAIAKAEGTE